MARARLLTVPRPAPAGQAPTLNRSLRRWLERLLPRLLPVLEQSAAGSQADRYRKHFGAVGHALLLLYHGLSASPSLRQTYAGFASCPGLRHLSGLATSDDPDDERLAVSFSQVAASSHTRPAAFLAGLFPHLVAAVRHLGRPPGTVLPADLHAFDSTFLRLTLRLAPWLPGTDASDIPGVRVHLQYAPALDVPEQVLITTTRTADSTAFDQMVLAQPAHLSTLHGHTVVLDLGYYGHQRFARLRAAGLHFVSRTKAGARVTVMATVPPAPAPATARPTSPPDRIQVQTEQCITLGSPNNRAGAVLSGLRRVVAVVQPLPAAARRGAPAVTYDLVTDRWDLSAAEVVQVYLWRWQIELFFRWLKSHVRLLPVLGYSRNAVGLSVYLTLITHLLTVLAARALGQERRSPVLFRRLQEALAQVDGTPPQGQAAAPLPGQLAFPGWDDWLAPPA